MCFFLNVVMFLKNTDVDVFDDVLQNMQTMLMLEQRLFGVFHPPQIPYIYSPPPSSPHPPPRPPTSDLLIDIAHHHFQLPRLLLITISIKTFPMTKSVCMMFCVLMNIVKKHWHQYLFNNTAKILHRWQKAWCFRFLDLHTALWPKYWYSAKNVTLNSFYIHKIYYLNFII